LIVVGLDRDQASELFLLSFTPHIAGRKKQQQRSSHPVRLLNLCAQIAVTFSRARRESIRNI